MAKHEIQVSAVAFAEGDVWVAQGIEYDIVAHAADLQSLPEAFANAVMENACISIHLGREPMAGIRAAPEKFRRMYDDATLYMGFVSPPTPSPAALVPDVKLRVLSHVH